MELLSLKDLKDKSLSQLWIEVEANIDDPNINVDKLLKFASMSRTNLHRKLVGNLGMSATAFIRYVRLVRASQLLIEYPEMNISEVTMAVGFKSLSYFSRRFKELFDVCPVQFRLKYLKE